MGAERYNETTTHFQASRSAGRTSALFVRPPHAQSLIVLAHGAGAGIEHSFMHDLAQVLAEHGIASFRYNFPYIEQGRRRPDVPPLLAATVRSAVSKAREEANGLPLIAGGKSLGGRMTSWAAASSPLDGVRGLLFFGFPLHPAGKPGIGRADHLDEVDVPLLFLQGTRDKLADLLLLRGVHERLGARSTLHVVAGADHGFHVLKRSGRTDGDVMTELAATAANWIEGL